jgi:hypothetical protein
MRQPFTATVFVAILLAASMNVFAQSESRDDLLKQIEGKRAELAALEKKFLAPSEEDRAAFAEFLAQPDTGLIRLLPREVFDKDSKLTIRGGGAYYSFVHLTHAYGYGSDIELQQGRLSVGFAGADYGMLVRVGDAPVDAITLDHPSARFLSAYSAPTEEPQARLEYRRFGMGTTIDGLSVKSSLPVEINTTYVLRSINYSESDVLVAFKVIGKDPDGSVTLLWKLLKKYPKPELARTNQAAN